MITEPFEPLSSPLFTLEFPEGIKFKMVSIVEFKPMDSKTNPIGELRLRSRVTGGLAFQVLYHKSILTVSKVETPNIPICQTSVDRLWRGYDPIEGYHGCAVLAHIDNDQYLYIGSTVTQFTTPDNDVILQFTSPMGSNNVAHPIAYGEKNIYNMFKMQYVPIGKILEMSKYPHPIKYFTNPWHANVISSMWHMQSGDTKKETTLCQKLKTIEIHAQLI